MFIILEMLRHLEDVGAPGLDNFQIKAPNYRVSIVRHDSTSLSMMGLRQHNTDHHKTKLFQLGHPLRIFGKVT